MNASSSPQAHRSRLNRRVVALFLAFMLLHQADRLLIGPLKEPISRDFGLNNFQFGLVISGALLVSTILYPIWGVLYDRYARPKLLALASFIWGSTTWLSALAPTYPTFLITRASTGIDDSSYPGLYSLVADYFPPERRGRVYGLLQTAQPLGYLIGMVLALTLGQLIGWRPLYYLTGALGIVLAILIWRGVPEVPRGRSEPEFADLVEVPQFRFSWPAVRNVLQRPTMWFIFAQGFAGVFPWNVLTYFFFDYLASERGYTPLQVLGIMGSVVILLSLGYTLGGYLGDRWFRQRVQGRVLAAILGIFLGMVFLGTALRLPVTQSTPFVILVLLSALFMPFAAPNVLATIYDVTVPEVRSTAQAVEYFIENIGAATAPALAGWLADQTSLGFAMFMVVVGAWTLCLLLYLGALFTLPGDVQSLRQEMQHRAATSQAA